MNTRQAKLAARLFAAAQQCGQELRNLSNFFDDMSDEDYDKLNDAWYDQGSRVLEKHGLEAGVTTAAIIQYVLTK